MAYIQGTNDPDNLVGGIGDDCIEGGDDKDYLSGKAGNDYLNGGQRDDTLDGGDGNDTLLGDGDPYFGGGIVGGDSTVRPRGNDLLDGGSGNDYLEGGYGDDVIQGGDGDDTLRGGRSINPDYLLGLSDDQLYGGIGNDHLEGEYGDDELRGEDGNDTLNGQDGNDTLWGGNGDDWLSDNSITGFDLGESSSSNLLWGGVGNDTISVSSGSNSLWGEEGNDILWGGLGSDSLWGGEGSDYLGGSLGNNYLEGGGGKDTLIGDDGDDTLSVSGVGDRNNINPYVLEGRFGNDTYKLFNNPAGSIIYDWGGTKDALIIYEQGESSPEVTISWGLAAGTTGAVQEGSSLIVDLNKDGKANKADDLTILHFYSMIENENGIFVPTNQPGSGYIENLNLGGLGGIVVNSAGDEADANPNDGVADVDLATPGLQTTFRAAIQVANAKSGKDTITFDIPTGALTIQPQSALPTITDAVIIDAITQLGIEIDGSNAGDNTHGLTITGGNSTIRGLTINRFSGDGIRLEGNGGNVIEKNKIGTDTSGTKALGNVFNGVTVNLSADNKIKDNIISGNQENGVEILTGKSTGNQIQSNKIGTTNDSKQRLGNSGDGILIDALASDNLIGGKEAGTGNTIAYNNKAGVAIDAGLISTQGNAILGNSIFQNKAAGIDLNNDSVNYNDFGDKDTGANLLQNYPVLTSVKRENGQITIEGNLNSAPNKTYRLEFFATDSSWPSEQENSLSTTYRQEGEIFLGSMEVTTDSSGNLNVRDYGEMKSVAEADVIKVETGVSDPEEIKAKKDRYVKGFKFEVSIPSDQVSEQAIFTATATDPQNNTSEFFPGNALKLMTNSVEAHTGDYEERDFVEKEMGATILAAFKPKIPLADLIAVFGIKHFNWVQFIAEVPSFWITEIWENANLELSEPTATRKTPINTPIIDPILLDSNEELVIGRSQQIQNPDGTTTEKIPRRTKKSKHPESDDEKLFYLTDKHVVIGSPYRSPNFLGFDDTPSFPSWLLTPGQAGNFVGFETRLVGEQEDGTFIDWTGIGTNFTWKSNTVIDKNDIAYFSTLFPDLPPTPIAGSVFDIQLDAVTTTPTPEPTPTPEFTPTPSPEPTPTPTPETSGSDRSVTLIGTDSDDLIAGTPSNEIIVGKLGNDSLFGRLGNDLIYGNQGEDVLNGNQGNDTIYGGKGNDRVRGGKDNDLVSGDLGDDTLFGDLGNDTVYGGEGNDLINGNQGEDVLNGNQGNDTVYGGKGNDIVHGGKDDDLVSGDLGNDTLFGDLGNDAVRGGAGDDLLNGGGGNDSLIGGEGRDRFVLTSGAGVDTISDFQTGQDLMGLAGGLRFDQLIISQGSGTQAQDTLIRIATSGEMLASLTGLSSSSLTPDLFAVV